METQNRVEIEADASQVLAAVEEASELWGGEWERVGQGGRLTIPVAAGIRHGLISGQVSTHPRGRLSEIAFHIESVHYHLHRPSLVVLLIGAAGGMLIVVAPFFPPLFPLVPAGIVVSLAAWFLVTSRAKSRGSSEFLALVGKLAEAEPEPGSGSD